MISVLDSEAKIELAIGARGEMLIDGLIVLSGAEAIRVIRSLSPREHPTVAKPEAISRWPLRQLMRRRAPAHEQKYDNATKSI
jgi:hypothetical protein